MEKYILDGHKLEYHLDRVKDWLDGKRVAPITIDWALTQSCPYNCIYCYSKLQKNPGSIKKKHAFEFLEDCAEIGVKATSLVSDGESTIVPFFYDTVKYGKDLGIDMALATCGYPLKEDKLEELLSSLTYIRFNISAGEPERYSYIHGVPINYFYEVRDIIKRCVKIKKDNGLKVTIGLQMVLMPQFKDQIIPIAKFGRDLGVNYTVIKHCTDDELGSLKVNYDQYKNLYGLLREAESYSYKDYIVKAKWSKIKTGRDRRYTQCYGPPLFLQISGSGLVAPCGSFFSPSYSKYHIGYITKQRFRDIWKSDRYWEVMNLLSSNEFNAKKDCACLCLQDKVNEFLWDIKTNNIDINKVDPSKEIPEHINFI